MNRHPFGSIVRYQSLFVIAGGGAGHNGILQFAPPAGSGGCVIRSFLPETLHAPNFYRLSPSDLITTSRVAPVLGVGSSPGRAATTVVQYGTNSTSLTIEWSTGTDFLPQDLPPGLDLVPSYGLFVPAGYFGCWIRETVNVTHRACFMFEEYDLT